MSNGISEWGYNFEYCRIKRLYGYLPIQQCAIMGIAGDEYSQGRFN